MVGVIGIAALTLATGGAAAPVAMGGMAVLEAGGGAAGAATALGAAAGAAGAGATAAVTAGSAAAAAASTGAVGGAAAAAVAGTSVATGAAAGAAGAAATTAAGAAGAAAPAGAALGAAGPIGWIILGSDGIEWDCWKPIIHSAERYNSTGMLVKDLLSHEAIAHYDLDLTQSPTVLRVVNKWEEEFAIRFYRLPTTGQVVAHAEPVKTI